MKKLTIILVFIGLGFTCLAQEEVPTKVKSAFKTMAPKVKNANWQMAEDGEWQAEYKINDREVRAVFDEDGKWLGTTSEMDSKKLPAAVQKAIAEKYKGYIIEEAEMVEVQDEKPMYKVRLENGDNEQETMFYEDGRIVMSKNEMDEKEVDESDY